MRCVLSMVDGVAFWNYVANDEDEVCFIDDDGVAVENCVANGEGSAADRNRWIWEHNQCNCTS